ncbi:MAG: MATE family efflux transporter [Candidatus Methanomethylophilaceae archaeon]|nr:MATE family efflux transporter [Candidatus Methanomethylophilaceae archaeon]MBR4180603.1 MATE family efflux transporter [Candidatus Methanomethylophilaceae archaeon]
MDAEGRVEKLLGDPRKAIVYMAIPILIALLVAQLNVLVDRMWCSGLGVDCLAALAVAAPIYNVFVGLGSGLGVGASAVVSRMIGAKRKEDASACAAQSLVFALIFGIACTPVVILIQGPLFEAIGAEDVLGLSMDYMTPFSLSILLLILNGTVSGILTGEGATTQSTVMMVVLAFSNMVLDPVFIYWADMGIAGASVATVASTLLSFLLGCHFLFSRKAYLGYARRSFRFDGAHMKSVVVAGVPQMLEYCVLYGMDAVLNFLVILCAGSEGLAIFSTPDRVIEAIVVPAMAVGSALVPVASSAYGQRNPERMSKAFGYSVKAGILSVAFLSLMLILFSEQVMTMFTYSDATVSYRPAMAEAMTILALYAPFYSFNPLCSGYLQALGHPEVSVVCAVLRNAVLITFFYIAGQFSLQAIFWALFFGHVVGATIILVITRAVRNKVFRSINSSA